MAIYLGENEVGFNTTYGGIVPSGTSTIIENGIYDVTNFASASVSVAGGGGGITADDVAMRTISGDISGNASYIGDNAFRNCSALTTVSFPSATYISSYAFYNCSALTSANFPNTTYIGSYAFDGCPALTTVSSPKVTNISTYAFYNCSALTAASFPSATYIASNAFRSCSALTTVSFPNATTISTYAFAGCSALTTVSFPKATSIGASAFYSCSKLTTVSFPSATTISSNAFGYCYNLLSLYLLGSSIPTLRTGAFDSTPIGGYTDSTSGVYGSIFVPSSLYDQYIVATNWSLYSSRIVSLYSIYTVYYSSLTYWFENGMTWEDFIVNNSTYNNAYRPNYFYGIRNNHVRFNDEYNGYGYDVKTSNNSYVNATDTISANYSYEFIVSA